MTAVVETAGLAKRYGDLVAVDALNMAVDPGEVYGFSVRTAPGGRPCSGCCWGWSGRTQSVLVLLAYLTMFTVFAAARLERRDLT